MTGLRKVGPALVAGTLALAVGAVVVFRSDGRRESDAIADLSLADVAIGESLYGAHCASCHGGELEGAPDWQTPGAGGIYPAPPHDETGHTWHHDDATLFAYTKLGGAGALNAQGLGGFQSGMPAFEDVLTEAEIRDVLAFIQSTWPERIRAARAARSGG